MQNAWQGWIALSMSVIMDAVMTHLHALKVIHKACIPGLVCMHKAEQRATQAQTFQGNQFY